VRLSIGTIDLTIIVAYLLAVVAFGLWVGRRTRDATDYLLGGRSLPWWAVFGSIVATETSTVTFLSVPGLAFAANGGDLRFLQLAFGYVLGRAVVVLVILPLYFRGQLFTSYQVLDQRFGGATKSTASVLFLVTRNLADGMRLFLTAIVLEKVVGLPLPTCIIFIGVATIVYTVFGGMRSVVFNDCVQLIVYMAGAVLALGVVVSRLPDGWSQVSAFAAETDKFRVFDFSFDFTQPYTFWAGIIGGMFLTMGTHGTDQMIVQRYLSARSQRDASVALLLSGVAVAIQFLLFLLLGVALAAFYHFVVPDATFENTDEVFATFIVRELPVGIVGITLAAAFAAAMSTLSSSLNSSAASAVNDLYLPTRKEELSPQRLVRLSRILTVVFGIVQIGVGIAARGFASNVVGDVLAIAGFTTGIILGVFFLGIFTQHVSQRAALIGLVGGIAYMTAIKFATSIAWPWFTIIGSAATFGLGYAASMATAKK